VVGVTALNASFPLLTIMFPSPHSSPYHSTQDTSLANITIYVVVVINSTSVNRTIRRVEWRETQGSTLEGEARNITVNMTGVGPWDLYLCPQHSNTI
jgi:hypothetical protein